MTRHRSAVHTPAVPSGLLRASMAIAAVLLAMAGVAIGWDWGASAGAGRALWPWPDGPLSYRFVASILLAEATVLAWQAIALDLTAVRSGAAGFALMNAGLAVFMGMRSLASAAPAPAALGWAIATAVLALGSVGLFALSFRVASPDRQSVPTPTPVRVSFAIFAAALFIATAMLLAQAAVVFPWPLKPESSVAFGFLFLASACYFLDGFIRPFWSNAIGQLLGFLVYDLVLIVPWIALLPKATGGHRISLIIYIAVLVWSGVLAIWYLFVHPSTRLLVARPASRPLRQRI